VSKKVPPEQRILLCHDTKNPPSKNKGGFLIYIQKLISYFTVVVAPSDDNSSLKLFHHSRTHALSEEFPSDGVTKVIAPSDSDGVTKVVAPSDS